MTAHGLFNWLTIENHSGGLAFIVFVALLWRLVYTRLIVPALAASPYRQHEKK